MEGRLEKGMMLYDINFRRPFSQSLVEMFQIQKFQCYVKVSYVFTIKTC